jgi:glycosyltransferase involved in cell wall biosynthesis
MRILHVDTGEEMRGGQWQALYLIEGLVGRGHHCALYAPRSSPLKGVAKGARSGGHDIVHAHDAGGHTTAALLIPGPLVVSRRVAFPVKRGWLSRWKYRQARHYIAVSEFVKGRLIEAGVDPERVTVVYDGVPLGEPGAGGRRVVAIESADPKKGSALIRDAAACGGFRVHFSSRLDEDLHGDAALFLYVTEEEGLGSAALLAMAAGVPVVASRVGGLPEAVADGETGVLVGNDPNAIARAVRELLAQPERARAMGAAGRLRVERRFTVDRMVEGTLAVYDRILSC